MLKNILLLKLLFLSCFFNHAQSSIGQIDYKVKLYPKENNQKKTQLDNLITEEVNNIELELIFNKNRSLFRVKKAMEIDNKTKYLRKMANLLTGIKGVFFVDLDRNIIINEKDFGGVNYLITDKHSKFDWKLTNEKKIIQGYICYKAKTINTYLGSKGIVNLNVTAWYAPEIPIAFGPKNYGGLPGLILELHEGEFNEGRTYFTTKMSFNSNKIKNIDLPTEGKEITLDQFHQIANNAFIELKNNIKN